MRYLFFLLVFLIPNSAFATACSFSNTTAPSGGFAIGYDAGHAHYATRFTVASACVIDTVLVKASVGAGSPSDDMTVAIYNDNGGDPSVLETGSNINVVGGATDYTSTFAGTTELGVANYWLVLGRSGSLDASSEYAWSYDTGGSVDPKRGSTGAWITGSAGARGYYTITGHTPTGGGGTPPAIVATTTYTYLDFAGANVLTWFWLQVGAVFFDMLILALVVYWVTKFGINIIKNLL